MYFVQALSGVDHRSSDGMHVHHLSFAAIASPWSAECLLCAQPPKRGLSLEEKRQKIQKIFHDTQDVFQLKVYTAAPPPPPLRPTAKQTVLVASSSV